MSILPNPLEDSGNHDAIPETPSPGELATKAATSSSQLYVDELMGKHIATCPMRRQMRKFNMLFAAMIGAMIVLASAQAILIVAGKAMLKETIREVVRQEMSDIHQHVRARVENAGPAIFTQAMP
jgi:hypothetical protein